MHLEKISNNKIKCTLSEQDLKSRNLNLSELAYGGEKARQLFAEMLEQANEDFDFHAENVPITIEAIPVSREYLILIITKMDDVTNELDSRFSHFNIPEDFDENSSDYENEGDTSLADADQGLHFTSIDDYLLKDEEPFPVKKPAVNSTMLYSFRNLDTLIDLSLQLDTAYNGVNSLYKDEMHGIYYLAVHQSHHLMDEFVRVCHLISEYGTHLDGGNATEAYYKEHYTCIARQTALQRLRLF